MAVYACSLSTQKLSSSVQDQPQQYSKTFLRKTKPAVKLIPVEGKHCLWAVVLSLPCAALGTATHSASFWIVSLCVSCALTLPIQAGSRCSLLPEVCPSSEVALKPFSSSHLVLYIVFIAWILVWNLYLSSICFPPLSLPWAGPGSVLFTAMFLVCGAIPSSS